MATQLDRRARLAGHLWTIGPSLLANLRPPRPRKASAWNCTLVDPAIGEVTIRGALQANFPVAEDLLIVLHGLGGHADRHYCVRAANAALDCEWHALRISARGADRSGEDIHHGGLTADLEAVLGDPSLASYRRIHLLGFSLGGHVVLRYLCGEPDPRVVSAATVCAPLNLSTTGAHLDGMQPAWYRTHLLQGLKEIYRACEARGRARGDGERAAAASTLREFDAATIVPRFGFEKVDDYYEGQSAVRVLSELKRPVLFVASTRDPMVPVEGLRAELSRGEFGLETRWVDAGGHVGFPGDLNLGFPGARGLYAQLLRWMGEQ